MKMELSEIQPNKSYPFGWYEIYPRGRLVFLFILYALAFHFFMPGNYLEVMKLVTIGVAILFILGLLTGGLSRASVYLEYGISAQIGVISVLYLYTHFLLNV